MAVKVGTEMKWVCISELSSNRPFYNGSDRKLQMNSMHHNTFITKMTLEMK
jgi:CDGSH-type Zn-finger protein